MRVQRWRGASAGSREHVAVTLGANLALAAMNAATGIALARLMRPEGRGELQAVMLWGHLLGTFGALGIPEAVVYFVARKKDETRQVVASSMTLGLASGALFLGVGWFVIPVVLGGQSDETKRLAQMFLLIIPFFIWVWMAAQALRGLSLFGRWNLMRISQAALWLGVVVGAWLTGHFSVGVLAFGYGAALALQLLVNLVVLTRSTKGPYRVEPSRWRPMLRFGMPNVLGSVPQNLNLYLDQLLLIPFVSADRLGLYVVAVAWAGALAPILSALGSVLFPRVAGEVTEAERLRIVAKGFRLSSVIACGSVLVLLALTYPGIRLLFGAEYVDAIPAALVLVVAMGVLTVMRVLQEGFRGLGRPTEVLWSELTGLAATAVLLLALLRSLDITGAAIASLGGYSLTLGVLLVRLRRAGGQTIHGDLVPTLADVREVTRSAVGLVRRNRHPAD